MKFKHLHVDMGISMITTADPREFSKEFVNEKFPEFQLEFGFALTGKGIIN